MNKSNRILSDITVFMKYAKYIPETKRRETWDQLVFRNESMHIKKFPKLEKEIRAAYEDVYYCRRHFIKTHNLSETYNLSIKPPSAAGLAKKRGNPGDQSTVSACKKKNYL